MPYPTLFSTLDGFGVLVFAIAGAIQAGRKDMDIFGMSVVAVVTAVGGGTLRDLLLGATPVFWVQQPYIIGIALLAALATFGYAWVSRLPPKSLRVADALGLAVFVVLGTQKALSWEAPLFIAVLMGVMSGVTGGIIRDLLCGEIPYIFRNEIYATAALLGALVYALGTPLLGAGWGVGLSLLTTLGLRLMAVYLNWSLPAPRNRDRRSYGP